MGHGVWQNSQNARTLVNFNTTTHFAGLWYYGNMIRNVNIHHQPGAVTEFCKKPLNRPHWLLLKLPPNTSEGTKKMLPEIGKMLLKTNIFSV